MSTSWRRFGCYEVSFGGAAPVFFDTVGRPPVTSIVALMDGPRADSVRVVLSVSSAVAQRLAASGVDRS
jgi:hypothetical protein